MKPLYHRHWSRDRAASLRILAVAVLACVPFLWHGSSLAADTPKTGVVQEIIGGREVTADVPPWMVALVRTDNAAEVPVRRRQFCGGVLISDEWVLTAAHCVLRSTVANTVVLIGQGDIEAADAQLLELAQIVAHPDYNPRTYANDVALLKLALPTKLEPVTVLAEPLELDLVGGSATVYGWGQAFVSPKRCAPLFAESPPDLEDYTCRIHDFERASRDYQARLLQANLTLLSKADCNARVLELLTFLGSDVSEFDENSDFTPPDQFCAFDADAQEGVCFGDSGGPITVEHAGRQALLGTASLIFGVGGCARHIATDVFTLTASFDSFIEDVMHRDYSLTFESLCPKSLSPVVEYGEAETSGTLTRILWSPAASVNRHIVRYSDALSDPTAIETLLLDGSTTEISALLPPAAKFYVSIQAENDSCTGPVSKVLEVQVPIP